MEVVVSSAGLDTAGLKVGNELPPVTMTELTPAKPASAETDFGFTAFFLGAACRPARWRPRLDSLKTHPFD